MLPGIGKMKKQIEAAGIDDKVFKRQQALISSMTRQERRNPKILNAKRKQRVAAGSGTSVQDLNKLLKMHLQMADMMKRLGRAKGGLLGGLGAGLMNKMTGGALGGLPGMGGMPAGLSGQMGGGMPDLSKMNPQEMERMAREMGMGGGMPKLPGGISGLPGMGRKK